MEKEQEGLNTIRRTDNGIKADDPKTQPSQKPEPLTEDERKL